MNASDRQVILRALDVAEKAARSQIAVLEHSANYEPGAVALRADARAYAEVRRRLAEEVLEQ